MANINIRIDDTLKARFYALCDDLGLAPAAAIGIFVKTAVNQNRIPFELTLDPFYSRENQEWLVRSLAQLQSGKAQTRELIEVADE